MMDDERQGVAVQTYKATPPMMYISKISPFYHLLKIPT